MRTCLFLAACRDSFSLAELCPCCPLWRGSRHFCAVTSPGEKQKTTWMSWCSRKVKSQNIETSQDRLILFREGNKRGERYKSENRVTSGLSILGGIMFAQRQLGAFEKMWDTVSQRIHLQPSHCLSHRGCNPSCNPIHFCLGLWRLRQWPGQTALKFTFLYKRRTWIAVNLRAIPIHMAPGPSPIQR